MKTAPLARRLANVYVCYVSLALPSAPPETPLGSAIRALADDRRAVPLIAGAPGMGKTSVLAAAAEAATRSQKYALVWIAGSVVAGEGHFARLLSAQTLPNKGLEQVDDLERALNRLGKVGPTLLAIDDLDILTYKRERTVKLLGDWVRHGSNRLAGSCSSSSVARLSSAGSPMVTAIGRSPTVVPIELLDDAAARTLVKKRAPSLTTRKVDAIIQAAAGHPAALVFLSRLTELNSPRHHRRDAARPDQAIVRASEFAGAAYAESWASLGPQQRAILWQLSQSNSATAAEVARALALPASHISAQITRLVADALAQRASARGRYTVAPLLAEWIARRAARATPLPHSSTTYA